MKNSAILKRCLARAAGNDDKGLFTYQNRVVSLQRQERQQELDVPNQAWRQFHQTMAHCLLHLFISQHAHSCSGGSHVLWSPSNHR